MSIAVIFTSSCQTEKNTAALSVETDRMSEKAGVEKQGYDIGELRNEGQEPGSFMVYSLKKKEVKKWMRSKR